MTNMSIRPLWLTYFIEILMVFEFQFTRTIVGAFSYKAHFRPQISSNACLRRFLLSLLRASFSLFVLARWIDSSTFLHLHLFLARFPQAQHEVIGSKNTTEIGTTTGSEGETKIWVG